MNPLTTTSAKHTQKLAVSQSAFHGHLFCVPYAFKRNNSYPPKFRVVFLPLTLSLLSKLDIKSQS